MRPLFWAAAFAGAIASVSACDDDGTVSSVRADDAGVAADDGGRDDEDHGGHHEPSVDAGPPPIRCTEQELAENDWTDGGAHEIAFLFTANPKQYTPNCVTIRVGSTVTFTGGFRQHPLRAAGGDEPNPIPHVTEDQPDGKQDVSFPNEGIFGFECEFHTTLMYGAVRVVP